MKQVKLKKAFVPGKFDHVFDWLASRGTLAGERVEIADNTTVRWLSTGGTDATHAVVYRFYDTDILSIERDGSIRINSCIMSPTTKSRLDQFLEPLNMYVFTEARRHYLAFRGSARQVRLTGDYQEIKF